MSHEALLPGSLHDDAWWSEQGESHEGIDPDVWGPSVWRGLHFQAEAVHRVAAPEQKEAFASALLGLGALLPCHKCRRHYPAALRAALMRRRDQEPVRSTENAHGHAVQLLARQPIVGRHDARRLAWLLHDEVNLRLGRPSPAFDALESRMISLRK